MLKWMQRCSIIIFSGFILITAGCSYCQKSVNTPDPNRILLRSNFRTDGSIGRQSFPIINSYRGYPGCYVACYSRSAIGSAFEQSSGIYVNGFVRVRGHYQDGLCQPKGYVNQDISKISYFKENCARYIKSCRKNRCWAGGDTLGFLPSRFLNS